MDASGQPTTPEEERDLVRQGERTVDNLKRLFAVLFSLSFGVLGAGIIGKLAPLADRNAPAPPLAAWAVNLELSMMFVITAGVFYHQSTKFLDIRYAKSPRAEARPWGFAFDYATLVLTAAPFFLMAHGLSPEITHKVGYLWFFASYVLLLAFGLLLLLLQHLRHSVLFHPVTGAGAIPQSERKREAQLRTYWLVMNSAILLVISGSFDVWTFFERCPVSPRAGEPLLFLYLFGGVALLRDVLDYRYSWRFIYPLGAPNAVRDFWPLSRIVKADKLIGWSVVGYAMMGLCLLVGIHLQFWDVSRWVNACAV